MQHDGDHNVDKDGWFTTGDVATICPLGHMAITDRSKDVIKSGGEHSAYPECSERKPEDVVSV